MPSLKAIKKRITSVKSTQKITRAMKLVSAAKLRRAQERAQQSRPFEEQLRDMVSTILVDAHWSSALLEVREIRRVGIVVYTTDRGLCGSLNANVLKAVMRRAQELAGTELEIISIGKRGGEFLRRRGFKIHSQFSNLVKTGSPQKLAEVSKEVRGLFTSKYFDRVEIFYPRFQSAMAQKPTQLNFLPYEMPPAKDAGLTLFEPKGPELLDKLVPMLLDFQLYQFLLEAIACEHAARMAAMESATKNSKEMIERLTLERNRARQAVITKELMEIIGGAEAISA